MHAEQQDSCAMLMVAHPQLLLSTTDACAHPMSSRGGGAACARAPLQAEARCWRQEECLGAAKVDELQVAPLVQQQVLWLQVPVDDLLGPAAGGWQSSTCSARNKKNPAQQGGCVSDIQHPTSVTGATKQSK
jgi:hypothetical protein